MAGLDEDFALEIRLVPDTDREFLAVVVDEQNRILAGGELFNEEPRVRQLLVDCQDALGDIQREFRLEILELGAIPRRGAEMTIDHRTT